MLKRCDEIKELEKKLLSKKKDIKKFQEQLAAME